MYCIYRERGREREIGWEWACLFPVGPPIFPLKEEPGICLGSNIVIALKIVLI